MSISHHPAEGFRASFRLLRVVAVGWIAVSCAPAAERLDPLDYPAASRLQLGTVPVRVAPARVHPVKVPFGGRLHVAAGERGERLAEGTVWAEFEPERMRLEREAFDLAAALLEEKEKPGFRLEQSEARMQLENRLNDLERQRGMLDTILKEPELAELYLREEGREGGDAETVRLMRERLAGQIGLLRTALDYVGTPRQAELELRILELKMRQQRLDLERREQEGRLRMTFDGEIQWRVPLPENHREAGLAVDAGMEVATLVDYGRLNVRMVMRRVDWRVLPVEALVLRFPAATISRPLEARFVKRATAEVTGREELVYDFQFEAKDAVHARPLVGGTLMAELVVELGREARLVPKMDLVLAAPGVFRDHGWVDAIPKVAPGWRAHTIGQSELALVEAKPEGVRDEP
jgi:hypothetical protein